jgi:hypothetical protein
MGQPTVLKGVFKEGAMIASVVQQDGTAKIMLKGAEPAGPGDASFNAALKKVSEACKPHTSSFETRELVAVLLQSQALAEHVQIAPEEVSGMGLTQVSLMDADCGAIIRVIDSEPAPIPLAYGSLRAGGDMADQPGIVLIPELYPRKTFKQLVPPQQQVYGAAAQVAGRGLLKLVCVEDEGLKLAVTVRDCPPPRARTVLVPLSKLAEALAAGTALDEIGKRLGRLRT